MNRAERRRRGFRTSRSAVIAEQRAILDAALDDADKACLADDFPAWKEALDRGTVAGAVLRQVDPNPPL